MNKGCNCETMREIQEACYMQLNADERYAK